MELVAAEPIVMDPVDMEFDRRGRVFVLEMGGYPEARRENGEFPGKVVLISDSDRDGVYDQRSVFAGGFQYADSILPYRDGLQAQLEERPEDAAESLRKSLPLYTLLKPKGLFLGLPEAGARISEVEERLAELGEQRARPDERPE